MISCENYIDRMVRAHSWEQLPYKSYDFAAKTPSPLPDKWLNDMFKEDGPDENTPAAYKLEQEAGFV